MTIISAATSAPRFLTLALLTGLTVLSLNMFLPSLPSIADEFLADYSVVSLAVAGYLALTAVLQLIIGPLSDCYGRRPVLLSALSIFVLASLGCMLATAIWPFLFFRMLQGAIISGWMLSLAVIRDTTSEQEAASRIGFLSMAMAVAPMLGPILGGALDELFGWRSTFLVLAAFGVAVLGLCWVDLGETNRHRSDTLTSQFLGYPELVGSRQFWGCALCIAFSTGAFYIFLAGSPLVAEAVLGLSPAMLGIGMGSITAGFALGSLLSGRYAGSYRLTTMMLSGIVVSCTGLVAGLVLFLTGFVHVLTLFGATVLTGLGNGLTMPSANAGALSAQPRMAGSAAGLVGALTVAGGAVLTAIAGAVLTAIAGAVLTAEHGAIQLLGLMLACSLMALFAALDVLRVNGRELRACAKVPAR